MTATCAVCWKKYDEVESLGKWECLQHPCDPINGVFVCCGTPANQQGSRDIFYGRPQLLKARGCVRCDHNTEVIPYTINNGRVKATYRYITHVTNILPESLEKINAECAYVYKYDKTKTDAQFNHAAEWLNRSNKKGRLF